jgi:hypothetical protein
MKIKNFFSIMEFLVIFSVLIFTSSCYAQLANWRYELPITITNNSPATLINYQVLIRMNTRAFVNAGYMQPNGKDIRFASNCGSGLLDFCLENYMNTDSTRLWVKIGYLAPSSSTIIYLFMGNPSAEDASTLALFEGPYSSTGYVIVDNVNTLSNCQRGFRFSPDRDILVTHFGKRVPNSTPRYVTLFDFNSHSIISQKLVSGSAPGVYNYNELSRPVWLTAGGKYVIEVFQGNGDNYYYGVSSQVGPYLTYYDMRYNNDCSQNTFPNHTIPSLHYGTPDFLYYVPKPRVNPEPTTTLGLAADTNTPAPPENLYAIAGNQQALLIWDKNTEFDVEGYRIFKNTVNDPYSASQIGSTNQPDTNFLATGLINSSPYYFWVKAVDRYCNPRVSGFSNFAYISPLNVPNEQEVPKVFALSQNYPNPFNPATGIKYDIPKESFVKLVIYDLLGREVSVLVNETQMPGRYTAKWKPENMPSGVYIYKLTAGNSSASSEQVFEKTMKMVLLK